MGRHLRAAGYGVGPDRAILSWDSYDAATNQQAPGFPDAFAVHFRDELFRRRAQSVAPNLITLRASEPLRPGQELRRGQILLVICERDPSFPDPSVDENPPHVFVTVGEYVGPGSTEIPLDQTPVAASDDRPTQRPGLLFHEQDTPGFSHPCFSRAASARADGAPRCVLRGHVHAPHHRRAQALPMMTRVWTCPRPTIPRAMASSTPMTPCPWPKALSSFRWHTSWTPTTRPRTRRRSSWASTVPWALLTRARTGSRSIWPTCPTAGLQRGLRRGGSLRHGRGAA